MAMLQNDDGILVIGELPSDDGAGRETDRGGVGSCVVMWTRAYPRVARHEGTFNIVVSTNRLTSSFHFPTGEATITLLVYKCRSTSDILSMC